MRILECARRAALSVCAVLVVHATPCSGQSVTPVAADSAKDPHAAQPERPTVATHAGTVAPGWLEIEFGLERDQLAPSSVAGSSPTVLKVGLADNVQLGIFGGASKPVGENPGVGDAGVGIKWRLVDDAPILGDFAVLPAVKLPLGSSSKGTGTGTTDGSLLLISSHDFGGTAMDINVGYTHRSGNGNVAPRDATLWTVSFGGSLLGRLGYAAECYGYPATSGPSGQHSIVALLAGPTFQFQPWFVVDAGFIAPLTGPQPHAVYAGLVYNVGRIWGGRT